MLKLSQIWPVEAPLSWLLCPLYMSPSFCTFRNNKIIKVHLVLFLLHPWNQPFLQGIQVGSLLTRCSKNFSVDRAGDNMLSAYMYAYVCVNIFIHTFIDMLPIFLFIYIYIYKNWVNVQLQSSTSNRDTIPVFVLVSFHIFNSFLQHREILTSIILNIFTYRYTCCYHRSLPSRCPPHATQASTAHIPHAPQQPWSAPLNDFRGRRKKGYMGFYSNYSLGGSVFASLLVCS